MKRKDLTQLELIYEGMVNEMAYGIGANSTPINIEGLTDLFRGLETAIVDGWKPPPSFFSITMLSEQRPRKRSNPDGLIVVKVSQFQANSNIVYEEAVNRARSRSGEEQDFEAGPSKLEYVSLMFRRNRAGELLLAIPPKTGAPSYFAVINPTTNDVNVVPGTDRGRVDAEVAPYAYVVFSDEAAVANHQGLAEGSHVMWRTPKIKNIAAAAIKGREYHRTDLTPVQQQAYDAINDMLRS